MAAAQVDKAGYKGFGSFHSDNVEELVRQDDASYRPPPPPFPDPCAPPHQQQQLSAMEFGDPMRSQFLIDFDRWTFLNHGAFGGVLRPVMTAAEGWRRHAEAQPLCFLDRELLPHLVHVLRRLAALLHCRPTELALVPNATTGLNTIITSMALAPGDVLFSLGIGYGSVKKMLARAAADSGAAHVELEVTFPLRGGPEALVAQVAAALPPRTRLAVFDAVTSNTGLVLPLEQLVALCHARGVQVLIDGAHALGQLPVNLSRLAPDYWVTNCHKWWAGARGCALLFVCEGRQSGVRPLVVSHGSGAGYTSDFIWDGCRDYAPALSLLTSLHWWAAVGLQRAQAYQHQLLAAATGLLVEAWGTWLLAPLEWCGAMALVALPPTLQRPRETAAAAGQQQQQGAAAAAGGAQGSEGLGGSGGAEVTSTASQVDASTAAAAGPGALAAGAATSEGQGGGVYSGDSTSTDAKYVQDTLHYSHQVEVPVKCIQGVLYCRVSAGLYNVLDDYQRLAQAVHTIAEGYAGGGAGAGGGGAAAGVNNEKKEEPGPAA